MAPRKRTGRVLRWIVKDTVWHKRAGRYIVRKDGQPFRFPIFGK